MLLSKSHCAALEQEPPIQPWLGTGPEVMLAVLLLGAGVVLLLLLGGGVVLFTLVLLTIVLLFVSRLFGGITCVIGGEVICSMVLFGGVSIDVLFAASISSECSTTSPSPRQPPQALEIMTADKIITAVAARPQCIAFFVLNFSQPSRLQDECTPLSYIVRHAET